MPAPDAVAVTGWIIGLCFLVFVGFWIVTAFSTKRTVQSRGWWRVTFVVILLGSFDGDITCPGELLVGAEARVRADIEAHDLVQAQFESGEYALVCGGDDWPGGIVGLVAGKLAQAYNRPTLVYRRSDGMVSGSGRKPWRQKGTGRARVGETRTPLWRHGGTVFGPQPTRRPTAGQRDRRLPRAVRRRGPGRPDRPRARGQLARAARRLACRVRRPHPHRHRRRPHPARGLAMAHARHLQGRDRMGTAARRSAAARRPARRRGRPAARYPLPG